MCRGRKGHGGFLPLGTRSSVVSQTQPVAQNEKNATVSAQLFRIHELGPPARDHWLAPADWGRRLLRGRGPVVAPARVLPALVPVLERLVLRQPAQHMAAISAQRGRQQETPAVAVL